MYKLISKLLVYRNIGEDSILFLLANAMEAYELNRWSKEETRNAVYTQIHRLLDVATTYGFDQNLWQNYLAFLLASVENPFSMTCEKAGKQEGSVNQLVKEDCHIFYELFHFDFKPIEEALEMNCFDIITDYHAIVKNGKKYHKNVSEKVRMLCDQLAAASDASQMFEFVTAFYQEYGVGKFGLNKAFRVEKKQDETMLVPITNMDEVRLNHLVGYELQKKKLVDNTKAFVQGRAANNVLLYGDSGTGKSTSVKAILNEYYPQGLRMIEIFKHQFKDLSNVIAQIKNRNYRFIIYMDDLSFEEFEIEYKYLKAVIEGGLETKPDNVLIYATSNRRHLIRETWTDRSDISKDELHRSDTMQEKLSLVHRFGVTIHYSAPTQAEYFDIVKELAIPYEMFHLREEELLQKANAWELSHGGLSGRTASQFITYMESQR